ncbi:MAG: hypothetical protein NT116_02985 [Candidatus Parcubacteria bacterium]|nr:hypothetical protein [Candidatus Parcubacteria bacterium]
MFGVVEGDVYGFCFCSREDDHDSNDQYNYYSTSHYQWLRLFRERFHFYSPQSDFFLKSKALI